MSVEILKLVLMFVFFAIIFWRLTIYQKQISAHIRENLRTRQQIMTTLGMSRAGITDESNDVGDKGENGAEPESMDDIERESDPGDNVTMESEFREGMVVGSGSRDSTMSEQGSIDSVVRESQSRNSVGLESVSRDGVILESEDTMPAGGNSHLHDEHIRHESPVH